MLLRGVNRSGFEYSRPGEAGFLAAARLTEEEIRTLCLDHRCNILRFPFNQDWALRGCGARSAEEYLAALDQAIAWAAKYGAYSLLDLQWLDAERVWGPGDNRVPPLPDDESEFLWRTLAARYRSEPAVLIDILNEPHHVTWDEWTPWAYRLIDAVREVNPDALLFVSGIDWGYDLRGYPLDREGLVYSTHVYKPRGSAWQECFGNLSATHPVFAAEWGGEDKDLAWGTRLADYFDSLGIGWTAWSVCDRPRLMANGTPTAFGSIVFDRLRA
jgi:hypothetical protein